MGRHEVGENGVSYLSKEAEKVKSDIRSKLFHLHHKCMKFLMHNGTHVGSIVGLHVVAIAIIEKSPLHYVFVALTH